MLQGLRGSFTPHFYSDTKNIDVMAAAYHKGMIKHLGKRLQKHQQARDLFELCESMVTKLMPTTASSWQPELGAILRTAIVESPDEAIINAMFALHALRITGCWEYTLTHTLRVSVAGHLFNIDGHISVQASPAGIVICRSESDTAPLQLAWTAGGLRYLCATEPEAIWQYRCPTFLTRAGFEHAYLQSCGIPESDTLPEIIAHWPIPPVDGQDVALAANSAAQVENALELLAQTGTNYLDWLGPLFRGMATCRLVAPDIRQSESYAFHPGVISCGFPLSTEFLSEVFVHEMSHQHYFLINSIVPLTNKNAREEIYFSSLKGRKRNLDKILMTYHATANMVLFWHDVIVGMGAETSANLREREVMVRHTRGLAEILTTAEDLTEAGKALFLAQGELMNERGYDIKLH